jgi:hypothetical protein
MKKLVGIMILIAFAVGVVGCGSGRHMMLRAKTELVGMSKADLLCCMGAPNRSAQEGNIEVLVYSRDTVFGSVSGGTGSVKTRHYEVVFVLRDDRVEKVTFGDDCYGLLNDFVKDAECGKMVDPCLKGK